MALLKWNEDEEKKDNDLFAPKPISTVSSVQSSWQPTADTASATQGGSQLQNENYLFSEEKAQVDQQLQQRREAEAAARAEAARQAAIARQNQANAQAAAELAQRAETRQTAQAGMKYGGGEQKSDGGFKGFLKNVGSGIQQGFGALGDIALQGGGVVGSFGKNDQELARHLQSVERVRSWLHGVKDLNGNQLTGTRDVQRQAGNIAAGRGNAQDFLALGGKGLQAGVDATMFVNPARIAAAGVTPTVARSASLLARTASNPAVRFAARDAAFFGTLQGTATFQSVYGETGDLEAATEAALRDAVVGGTLQGSFDLASTGINRVANRTANSLRSPREFRVGDNLADVMDDAEGVLTPVQERRPPAADAPAMEDGNVSFQNDAPVSRQPQFMPVAATLAPPPSDATPAFQRGYGASELSPAPKSNEQLEVEAQIRKTQDLEPLDDLTPAFQRRTERGITPVADGVPQAGPVVPAADPNLPTIKSEEARALQESRAGTDQAEEAAINQQLQELDATTPRVDGSVPEEVLDPVANPDASLTRAELGERAFRGVDANDDLKKRLARAVGMAEDAALDISDIIGNAKLGDKAKQRLIAKFNELEDVVKEENRLMKIQGSAYAKSGVAGLDDDLARQANSLIDKRGRLERELNSYVRKIEGNSSWGNRAANAVENLTGARNASLLTSVGGIERNITQELGASILDGLANPVRAIRSAPQLPAEVVRSFKRAAREWTVAPKTASEVLPYLIGNTYRTLMSPVIGIGNTRKGVNREALAEAMLRMQGETPSRADIQKFARSMGSESELVANNLMGILNGMTSRGNGLEVLRAYQDFIRTGDEAARRTFMLSSEKSANLATKLSQVAAESGDPKARIGVALMNTVFPFVNTAVNLTRLAGEYTLNPKAMSIPDEVLRAVRSNPQNVLSILKSRATQYGVMAGVYALWSQDVIGYNDGDEVDKPRGVYISLGDGEFFPLRGTPIELPVAAVVMAAELSTDVLKGDAKPVTHYAGMIGGSLPYVDSANNLVAAGASATSEYLGGDVTGGTGDNGYAAKAYGVNLAKSYVPFSNNGVIPALNAMQGESTNAKKVYDKDMGKWLKNSVGQAYLPAFRESLEDSRDAAGRVRTVDNQGGFRVNKRINDANTATHNEAIDSLVEYGKQAGLGKGVQDMFNTYDTGKNNNFKSVQDTITFLDVADGDKPDNAAKLEQNDKLGELAAQIRDGFYGDTGSELLTLDGKNLKSDVSVPNKAGTDNSKLPLSMQSIKNAIAETDLPEDQRDAMYAISQQSDQLWDAFKNQKAISYEQYAAAKAELGQQQVAILSNSPNYQKLGALMEQLDQSGFFNVGGIGSTKAGQTYFWNAINSLLGSKGTTPAAQYPDSASGFTPWGRGGGGGSGFNATNKPSDRENTGVKWTPVTARQMAKVSGGRYTPLQVRVKLGNEVKKDKTRNYSDRSF